MKNEEVKIIYISDFAQEGSGYLNISVPLCQGLADLGFNVKALGLGYLGEEHWNTFSLIPCMNANEVEAMLKNLKIMWNPTIVISAMDVPYQALFSEMARGVSLPYIGIMPLESDPLCLSWALMMQQMNKVFMISEFATNECKKRGVNAEHLQVGMDMKFWKTPTKEERIQFRDSIGIGQDEFVILTVADNQERKNLSAAMQIVSKFKKDTGIKKLRYILVTREHAKIGWGLRDLAYDLGINTETMILERGLEQRVLWSIYALSDVFLHTAKAEGLCMPVLEAMSVGIPVIATRTGALIEHLSEGRGFLIDAEYVPPPDPWGNSNRYFINRELATQTLEKFYQNKSEYQGMIYLAQKYIEKRTWDIPVEQVRKSIMEILKDVKTEEPNQIPA